MKTEWSHKGRMPLHTAQFKRSRESLEDDPSESQPVTTQETTAKMHDIIMADRRVKEYYTATKFGIPQDCIHNKLHISMI